MALALTHSMLLLGVGKRLTCPFGHRPVDRRLAFVSISHVSLFAGVTLFTAFLVGGSGYVIREAHRQIGVAKSILPIAQVEPEAPFLITQDMFHVTSIALGRPPLAMVNGIAITEGDALIINVRNQIARVRVIGIADGTVTFKSGSQTVSTNLSQNTAKKTR